MKKFFLILSAGAVFMGGCARDLSPYSYGEQDVGQVNQTYAGTILSMRRVMINGADRLEDHKTGMAVGAIAGGLLGSAFGKGRGKIAGIAGGALLGGTAGTLAEKNMKQQEAIEYTVELDSRQMRTVVQGGAPLMKGQRVLLIMNNKGRSRITPFEG
jgi:outer membrane lipoprotein SlyB